MTPTDSYHQPVMVDEVVEYLITSGDGIYVDATAGGGGHSAQIVSRLKSSGRVLAIDRDDEAVTKTQRRLQEVASQTQVLQGEFSRLRELIQKAGVTTVNGVLFDLGVSSHQLDDPRRGFSYRADGPLDLRMDRATRLTATELVNKYSRKKLATLFYELGGEKNSRKIAAAIEINRQKKKIESTEELTSVVKQVTNPRYLNKTLSRVFQALRIEVNDELNQLLLGLNAACELLCSGGRLVVISYHSLEDGIVKRFMRECARQQSQAALSVARILTKKPIMATPKEIELNPRARSARLRALEKV